MVIAVRVFCQPMLAEVFDHIVRHGSYGSCLCTGCCILRAGFILELSRHFDHIGTSALSERFQSVSCKVLNLRLVNVRLVMLKFGEHHLNAACRAEVDGVQNFGKT